MKNDDATYYYFPAELMKGFWDEGMAKECLKNAFVYHAAKVWERRDKKVTGKSQFQYYMCKQLNLKMLPYDITYADKLDDLSKHVLYNTYSGQSFQLSTSQFLEFLKEEKDDYERVGLLAFLACKSILGNRGFVRTNLRSLFSRMAGNKSLKGDIPKELCAYMTRRKFSHIRAEMLTHYKVAYVSGQGIKGFYISCKRNEEGEADMEWLFRQVQKIIENSKKDPWKEAMERVKSAVQ